MSATKKAYEHILEEIFKYDDNPTYELCQPTIENLVGADMLFNLVVSGLIQYVGRNHNGIRVYKIR